MDIHGQRSWFRGLRLLALKFVFFDSCSLNIFDQLLLTFFQLHLDHLLPGLIRIGALGATCCLGCCSSQDRQSCRAGLSDSPNFGNLAPLVRQKKFDEIPSNWRIIERSSVISCRMLRQRLANQESCSGCCGGCCHQLWLSICSALGFVLLGWKFVDSDLLCRCCAVDYANDTANGACATFVILT